MYLVASVHLSVRLTAIILKFKAKNDHYQSEGFVCVFVTKRLMRTILRTQSIGFYIFGFCFQNKDDEGKKKTKELPPGPEKSHPQ